MSFGRVPIDPASKVPITPINLGPPSLLFNMSYYIDRIEKTHGVGGWPMGVIFFKEYIRRVDGDYMVMALKAGRTTGMVFILGSASDRRGKAAGFMKLYGEVGNFRQLRIVTQRLGQQLVSVSSPERPGKFGGIVPRGEIQFITILDRLANEGRRFFVNDGGSRTRKRLAKKGSSRGGRTVQQKRGTYKRHGRR